MMQLTQTTIHFPDIKLKTRDAHKLRGYFGKLFKAHSPLLHNHFEDGSLRYAYPLVQYKIINNIAVLVGFNEGADLLVELFLKIKQLNIEKIIYLHSDMLNEAQTRFPYLYANFQMYKDYDEYISVSDDANKANRQNLAKTYDLDASKFDHCDSLLNPEEVIERAKGELAFPEEEEIFENSTVFINMARLSPEKDQAKLIRAFRQVAERYSESKLIILGQGPLQHELESLIAELSLENKVLLLGQRFNPMPYLKRSDCFVLSSNYEGQGLVLLEAMILKKAVISTDIVGPRSVLTGRPGHLVENSEEGLTEGMIDFLEGKYTKDAAFDYEAYNCDAMKRFIQILEDDKDK